MHRLDPTLPDHYNVLERNLYSQTLCPDAHNGMKVSIFHFATIKNKNPQIFYAKFVLHG